MWHWFHWGGQYRGIQVIHAAPQVYGHGGFIGVIGGPVDMVTSDPSVLLDPETVNYTYRITVTALAGDWFQYILRGQRVD